ncbi:MAG: M14 family metallopeptidase [Candidatus Paceibacterota bacterium]
MTEEEKKLLPLVIVLIAVAVILTATASYFALKEEPTPKTVEVEEIITSAEPAESNIKIIGTSVEGRNIESYTFGTGPTTLVFVGGIHGGYEWNSSLLAYQFIDELETSRIVIPDTLTIKIIPSLNPDGLYKIVGKEGKFTELDVSTSDINVLATARFNANDVDLNRNFACKWQPTSTWRGQIVDAGSQAFSEPEALALKNYVEEIKPKAVAFWHSQANAVYASECEEGILPETLTLMDTYATAANYPSVDSFDAYPISGDAEGWLASIGIPAITVELSTRDEMDWFKNKEGFEAVIDYYKIAR